MKKLSSVLFIIAILITACGAQTATPETSSTLQVSVKTPKPTGAVVAVSKLGIDKEALKGLEISVWYPWFGVEGSLFQSLVDDFNDTNQWGIKVNASGQVNFSNLYDNVTASLPTQNHPDLVIALPEHALNWDANGVLVEMTPYVDDPLYGIDHSDFPLVFWNQDEIGDRRIAIPAQRTARFLLWNESWAADLGFDAPPTTPDQFQQQACRAHETMFADKTPANDGKGGWILNTESMTAYSWLLAFEGGVLEGNNYRFLSPNNIKAFEFLKKLIEKSCAWQVSPNGDPFTEFATRQALFVTASLEDFPAVTRAFASANNTDKWMPLAFPGNNGDALVVYGSSYVMLKSSPEKQLAAWIFIRWLLDPQQDARLTQTTHLFPLRTSTLGQLADYQSSHPQWADAVKLIPEGELQPQLASWRTVKVMLGDGFNDMFFRTDITSGQVAKVLQQMQDTARDLSK